MKILLTTLWSVFLAAAGFAADVEVATNLSRKTVNACTQTLSVSITVDHNVPVAVPDIQHEFYVQFPKGSTILSATTFCPTDNLYGFPFLDTNGLPSLYLSALGPI